MKHYPLFLDLKTAPVVVAGEGDALIHKSRTLLAAGAQVSIVGRGLGEEAIGEFAGRARLALRAPRAGDFAGARLAIVAAESDEAAAELAAAARQAGALVNAVDRPELSDFILPAIVDRGEVVVAISTEGAAPVLARAIRTRIEALLPARLGALARFAGAFRRTAAGALRREDRRQFWERFFKGPIAARVLAGDESGARAAMTRALEAGDEPGAGVVHIVGAGPGDAELLTLRAHRLINEADVILYDRLVSAEVLALARRDATRIYVGKEQGESSIQGDIGERLVAFARRGLNVVRLKGGDPFIFGRGGEELEALRAAGIAAFVTPGITAALGCAAAAGMALTHRDVAHAVTLVAGHVREEGVEGVDWPALAALDQTIVVYMGVGAADAIAAALLAAGADPEKPVAVIENGTRANARVVKGALDRLGALVAEYAIKGPALLVIGEVAALADATPAARDAAPIQAAA
jgi:uroporphyrin-III C-methyltransferase/precorrin-2 dehydrogenase/sirohydrochlorin ferrochelatase